MLQPRSSALSRALPTSRHSVLHPGSRIRRPIRNSPARANSARLLSAVTQARARSHATSSGSTPGALNGR
jgi:hypothetical protein